MGRTVKDLKGLPDWPLMLSEEQAAAYTSLPDAAFRKAVDLGQLPESEDLAGHRRWNRQKIDRFRDRTPAALAGQPELGPFADPLLDAIKAMGADHLQVWSVIDKTAIQAQLLP